MFLKVRKPPLKIWLSKHICPSLGNGPVPRNLVDSFMFLVAYQCRMCEKSQNENATSATLKLNRGKSRVELTRIGRKVTGKKSKKKEKRKSRGQGMTVDKNSSYPLSSLDLSTFFFLTITIDNQRVFGPP